MPLRQDDDLIQTLPPDPANDPLDIRILPRRAGGHHFMDAHMAYPSTNMGAVDTVPIAEEIAWRLVPRERLDHLLGRPLRCWMRCDIEMQNSSSFLGQHQKYIQ